MGSLMAGWDSHVNDSKSLKFERNKSMTKDDIATYWRSKKNVGEVQSVLKPCHTFSKGDQINEIKKIYKRSNTLPVTQDDSAIIKTSEENDEENREKLFKKHGWWINSRWAFLNEPPVITSETPFRYATQFHVANVSNKKPATNGVRS